MARIPAAQAGGPNVVRFLDLIGWSEGTSTSPHTKDDGYDIIVTGVDGWETFADYHSHPFLTRPAKLIRTAPALYSTASGRYQLLARYYGTYKSELSLPDFGPLSQDRIAIQQLHECGALQYVESGATGNAIIAASRIWASMPGNTYGQGGHTVEALLAQYAKIPVPA